MEQVLTLLGTIASLGAIPLSIYLYLKSKEAKFDKIKKEIVKTLSYQIGEEREITAFEIQTVINSKLRDNRFKTNTIKIDEIVEDLVSETISSPMIDRNRKKIIIDDLKNVYIKGEVLEKLDSIEFIEKDKLTWENIEPKIKDLITSRQGIDETLRNLEKNETPRERISTWFAIIAAVITIVGGVVGYLSIDVFPLVERISQNEVIINFLIAIVIGIITSLLAGLLTNILKRRQREDKTKSKEVKKPSR